MVLTSVPLIRASARQLRHVFFLQIPEAFQANSKTNMKLNTYLNFDGNCEEALKFYKKALGAKLVMMMRFGMLVDQFGVPWIVNCEKKD